MIYYIKNIESKKNLGTALVVSILILAIFYRLPAYFMSYDSQPPLGFRLGKYGIGLLLALGALPLWFRQLKALKLFDALYISVFVVLAIQGFMLQGWDLLEAGFWPLIAYMVIRFSQPIPAALLNRVVGAAFLCYGLFLLAQIILLNWYSVRFMHATDSVLTSRFGGLTVEPLGAPMLCLLFLGWAIGLRKNLFYAVLPILFIAMTHTWSAYVFLAVVFGAAIYISLWDSQHRTLAITSLVVFLAGIFGSVFVLNELKDSNPFLAGKWTSVKIHASYWWPDRWLLLPSNDFKYSETVWVESVENLGIIWTLLFFGVLLYMCYRLFVSWKDETIKQVRATKLSAVLVSGYFLLGSLNLPYPSIFPANLIFYLFACLIIFDKVRSEPTAQT